MGEVFLLDWGIAKRTGVAGPSAGAAPAGQGGEGLHTQAGAVMGTPLYMSPEQVRGEAIDARSDLYSLCMVLYEFVRLRHPFAELTNAAQVMEAVLSKPIPHAASKKHPHQPIVPMDLSWLIQKGLSKDAAKRYQTAQELITRLDNRAEGNVPIQCHVTATKRASYEGMKLVTRHPFAFLFVLLAGLGAGVFALLR
jgi:serine/threonine-protein kinase